MKNYSVFFAQRKVQLLLIAFLTIFAFSNIFQNDFAIDDKTFFVSWQGDSGLGNILGLLGGALPAGHEGVYRPVATVFAAFQRSLWSSNPFGYHLFALSLHILASMLVYLIVAELIKLKKTDFTDSVKKWFPFITALLFGLSPIHTETVTYITGSGGVLAAVFFFSSFYFFLKRRDKNKLGDKNYLLSVLFAILAYFTYEVTFVLPFLLVLYEVCFEKLNVKKFLGRVKIYAPYVGGLVFYLFLRMVLSTGGLRGGFVAGSLYVGMLVNIKAIFTYLQLVVLPFNQAYNHVISPGIEAVLYRDYRQGALLSQSILDLDIILPLFFVVILVGLSLMFLRRYPFFAFGIGWFLIGLAPVSTLIPQLTILHERFLYIPSFGIILIFAYFLGRLLQTAYKNIALGALILAAAVYLTLTFSRNRDWHDDVSIWSADVKQSPTDNAYAYFQLGNAYASRGAVDLAIANYQNSFNINPHFVVALGSIAKTLNDAGKPDMAVDYYRRSLEVSPYFWEAHNNLAEIYVKRADFDLVAEEYRQILAIMPNYAEISQKLSALPTLKEATNAANSDDGNIWLVYRNLGGLSFKAPATWEITLRTADSISFEDEKREFNIQISLTKRDAEKSFEGYVTAQTEMLGKKINEGQAFVPNFDKAIVRVWQVETGTKLEFFLFKEDKVVRVAAGPTESAAAGNFDLVLGSLNLND